MKSNFDHKKAVSLGDKFLRISGISFLFFLVTIPLGIEYLSLGFFTIMLLSSLVLTLIGTVGIIFWIKSLIKTINEEIQKGISQHDKQD